MINRKFTDPEGTLFTVQFIANAQSKDKNAFPQIVVFTDAGGYVWALPRDTFEANFKEKTS